MYRSFRYLMNSKLSRRGNFQHSRSKFHSERLAESPLSPRRPTGRASVLSSDPLLSMSHTSAEREAEATFALAVERGDLPVLRRLVAENLCDAAAQPDLLYVACEHGHADVARFLLLAGCSANQSLADGTTPLFVAIQHGHENVAVVLLEWRADTSVGRTNGATPLYEASLQGSVPLVRLLLDACAPVDAVAVVRPKPGIHGSMSPLYACCSRGHADVARMLVAAHADPNVQLPRGRSPLHVAVAAGHLETVRVLLEHAWASESVSEPIRVSAAAAGHPACSRLALSHAPMGTGTPPLMATEAHPLGHARVGHAAAAPTAVASDTLNPTLAHTPNPALALWAALPVALGTAPLTTPALALPTTPALAPGLPPRPMTAACHPACSRFSHAAAASAAASAAACGPSALFGPAAAKGGGLCKGGVLCGPVLPQRVPTDCGSSSSSSFSTTTVHSPGVQRRLLDSVAALHASERATALHGARAPDEPARAPASVEERRAEREADARLRQAMLEGELSALREALEAVAPFASASVLAEARAVRDGWRAKERRLAKKALKTALNDRS